MKVLLDTYGSDLGEAEIIKGGIDALKQIPDLHIVFFGSEDLILSELKDAGISDASYTVVGATDFITNHDNPMEIFRGRNDSSMALALDHLKKDTDAAGLLSCGNTGALMVGAISRIGLKKGLSAPVLCSPVPSPFSNWAYLLDCGAHLTPSASDLVLFARLGAEHYSKKYNVASPRVGLLSVGSEESKGNELIIEAHKLLKESDLNFIGNVEGCDAQNGKCDVIVTDGLCGNIMIKCIESSGMTCADMLEKYLEGNDDPNLQGLLQEMRDNFHLTKYGGAFFLGIDRNIIKMHGASGRDTVIACVRQLMA